jgi:hypothetical protein
MYLISKQSSVHAYNYPCSNHVKKNLNYINTFTALNAKYSEYQCSINTVIK